MANQAWQITSASNLSLVTLPDPLPTPGPSQVLVRIHAAAFNYRDVLVVAHSPNYPILAKPNLVPCSDGAGEIAALGSAVAQWMVGDRVIVHPNTWLRGTEGRDWTMEGTMGGGDTDGTLRRWMVVESEVLVRAPEGWSWEEAATLYTAGVTAWRALTYGVRKVERGSTVLTMGTGGVSCFAIMIAAAAGATVVATSSSDEKLQVAKKLGATHLINYNRTPAWEEEVLRVTDGQGVDVALDVVGAHSIEQTIRATRQAGLIAHVGLVGEDCSKRVDIMMPLLYGAKTIQAFLGAGSLPMLAELVVFASTHQFRPQIAQVFEFEDAAKALDAVRSLSNPGKIVIKI